MLVDAQAAFVALLAFTYMWTTEGWLYVAVVIDLFSREVVGWSTSDSMTSQLVSDTPVVAISRRDKPDALPHHRAPKPDQLAMSSIASTRSG